MGPDISEVITEIATPRVMVVGAHGSVGVPNLVLGILVSMSRQKVSTAVGYAGDSLVRATHARRVTARLAHTLDPWALEREPLIQAFARLSGGAELVLIECCDGILDRYPEHWTVGSSAELAHLLKMPVVLVVDGWGYKETLAAMVAGIRDHDTRLQLKGVIANRVIDDHHNQRIRTAVEELGGITYLGGIPMADAEVLAGVEHAGDADNPSLLPRGRIIAAGDLVKAHINIDAMREIATGGGLLEVNKSFLTGVSQVCKIAVADDLAFHLTVQDNLDLIRRSGGQLKAFSPIADFKIPSDVGAIYLPNGYLHVYARDLAHNTSMIKSIADFAMRGGIIYAEGCGVAYLCKKVILSDGSVYDMCGALSGIASAQVGEAEQIEPVRTLVRSTKDNSLLAAGNVMRGFRERRWRFSFEEGSIDYGFELRDELVVGETHNGDVGDTASMAFSPTLDGFMVSDNILATTVQLHWGSCSEAATHFVRHSAKKNNAK